MGLLDDPTTALAMGLLASGGYSRTPISVGQGLASGYGAYQQAKQYQDEMAMRQQESAQRRDMFDLNKQQVQMSINEQQRKIADADATRQALRDFYANQGAPAASSQAQGGVPYGGGYSPAVAQAFGVPQGSPQAQMPQPSQHQGGMSSKADVLARFLALGDHFAKNSLVDQAQQYYQLAEKFRPKYKADSRTVRLPDGSIATVNMSEDGSEIVSGYAPAEKLVQQDLGGKTGFADPYSGKPVSGTFQQKTMTPGEMASNSLGWANNNLSKQRLGFDMQQANKPQFNAEAGGWVTAPSGMAPGQVQKIPGMAPKLTEVQGKSALFGARAKESDAVLRSLEGAISTTGLSAKQGIENAWGVGGILGPVANKLISDNQQKVDQAQRDFVNALLRQESGAAISSSEFDSARKQYFPQPGDSDSVIEQKRRNRQTAIAGLNVMAGPGAEMMANRAPSGSSGGWSATIIK